MKKVIVYYINIIVIVYLYTIALVYYIIGIFHTYQMECAFGGDIAGKPACSIFNCEINIQISFIFISYTFIKL